MALCHGLPGARAWTKVRLFFNHCRMGSDAAWEAMPHGKRCRMGSEGRSTVNGADVGATSDAAEVVFIGRPLGVPTPNETKTLVLVDVF